MDYSSIKTGLESFVERYDSQTYIGSYRETGRSSLLNDGLSTRANSLWKMAEYVVAKHDGKDNPLSNYINGWKQLAAGAANQYLLLEESSNSWGMYDSQGTRLGGEDYIQDYFAQQKRKQGKDTLGIQTPTKTVQQMGCDSRTAPYLAAIRTKPFLLLAGISGTGKSRIVRELAFMTCPEKLQDEDGTTPGNYCMIEVKPNWHDSTELLGYYSSFNGGGYRFTKFDRFVVKAWLNPDVPFFVCLDEMNLAPVEQYFAEFLSVLETRSRDKRNNVVTGALVDKQYFKDDMKMTNEFGLDKGDDWTIKVRTDLVNKGLTLPPNLIIIGTVNMDDTTYQFSRKVIDRAMTIEMNGGELSQMFGNSNSLKYRSDEDVVKLGLFKAPYINADEVIERYQSQAQIIKEKLPKKLEAVNTALKDTPFQVSYRVLNELVIYLGALMDEATVKGEAIDDDALSALIDQAMDQITLMKILPRIEGDDDMFKRSEGTNVLRTLQSLFSEDTDSYKKLEEMIDRLGRTGFTRFWP